MDAEHAVARRGSAGLAGAALGARVGPERVRGLLRLPPGCGAGGLAPPASCAAWSGPLRWADDCSPPVGSAFSLLVPGAFSSVIACSLAASPRDARQLVRGA